MNTPSVPRPERPSASGTNGSGDDVPPAPDQSEPDLDPAGGLTGGPGWLDGSALPNDGEDDDDEYEPL